MNKPAAIALISVSQVLVLSLWFAAAAVAPVLVEAYALTGGEVARLTSAVQAGFVAGCLISAFTGLADRLDPRRYFCAAALAGAALNLVFLAAEPGSALALFSRFTVGVAMAGVYPVGMKMAASWADKGDAGLLVGILVGALTLGSAAPHLFAFTGGADWRAVMLAASGAAALGGATALFVKLGPQHAPSPRLKPGEAFRAFRDPALRLANFGYLGHMWELYAMWAWIGAFLTASFAVWSGGDALEPFARLSAFLVIGSGAAGCVAAGLLADRLGRTAIASAAMVVSGFCALTLGWLPGAHPALILSIAIIWGVSVVADSAQFSAAIAELSPPELRGTMLTVQTACGFALTLVTIQLLPVFRNELGWGGAFSILALGPVFGVAAMLRLRRRPEAARLAGGRR